MNAIGKHSAVALAWFSGLLAVTACSSTTTTGLKTRFAREQSCPVDQVAVTEEGGEVYRAAGCGTDTEYVCESFAGVGSINLRCHERGSNPHEPSGEPPPQNDSRPDYVSPK